MDYNRETIRSPATAAEVLVRRRGYWVKKIEKSDNCVDVTTTAPKSRDKILIRIVTEPYLDSGKVDKQLVEEITDQLEDAGFEKRWITPL